MKKKINLILGSAFSLALISLISCGGARVKQVEENVSINELMASNRTGITTDKGKPADWLELKNESGDSIDLEDFEIAVIKNRPDSIPEDEWKEEAKTWSFPAVKIGPEECMVVFAEKTKKKKKADGDEDAEIEDEAEEKVEWKPGQSLIADLKFPKGGGKVQLRSPRGKVIKEVKYGKIGADQALVRENDTTYVATYWQSPGFDNTREGFSKAMEKIDGQRNSPLKIWEVMSRSEHSRDNWVELKNVSNQEISLSGYSLAKKTGKKEPSWNLPDRKLQPGEIIAIQMAGRRAQKSNPVQSDVKLGNAETVVLMKDGKFVDGICAKTTPIDASIGRANGKKGFYFYATPTRGEENGANGKKYVQETPGFHQKPGIYKENEITLSLKDKTKKVHYTTDGSEPTAASPILPDSIKISSTTVMRTMVEGDGESLKSPVGTYTYMMGVDHKIPVMNIAVNKSDMYDYNNGIYVDGPGYTQEIPHKGANYWKKWTKRAHVEFFDNKPGAEGFSTDCGLRIFGGFSRFEPKKSFRLKFRGQFANPEVDYDFFGTGNPEELEDIVIRSGAQDWNRCMVRDEFFTSLMQAKSPTLITQQYRPVALYINGEYFGLYYMREKIDNNFVARKLDVPNDSINIIFSKGLNELGSGIPYKQLIDYAQNNDMSNPTHFNYMRNNVDLQGLIDWKLGEWYSGNTDVGNIRYVRSTSPESDKKWHFIFYDLDASWVGYKPSPAYYLSTGDVASKANVAGHNILINRLLNNKEFRAMFLERLSFHMKNTFTEKNATAVFDNLVAQIKPEMRRNCQRWPQLTYEKWESNIKDFRSKFAEKPKVMMQDIREYLNITDAENKKYFAGL